MVQTEKQKAYQKEYRSRPERKEKAKLYKKKYNSSVKGQATSKAYNANPENKAKAKERKESPEGKISIKKYEDGKGKETRKKYNATPKRKAAQKVHSANPVNKKNAKNKRTNNRLKVLQVLSKRLSNSDIPCCNCCGLNSHLNFLDLDHILGKYEMDSIPELVELGYSSTKAGGVLNKWIKDNNYLKDLQTEYFQVLCKNCNGAKSDYGKCPMENKPH